MHYENFFYLQNQKNTDIILHNVDRIRAHPNTIWHCLYNYFFRGVSRQELATYFRKSRTTISAWINEFQSTGSVERQKLRRRVFRKFGQERRDWLVNLYKEKPILYHEEAAKLFFNRFKTTISSSSISVILFEAGLTYKLLEHRARQIRMDDILRFCNDTRSMPWILDNLVFLDEVSLNGKDCLRRRGYGKKGEPVVFKSEFSRGSRTSLLCFLGVTGILNTFITDGTFDRKEFINCCKKFALDRESKVRQYPGRFSIWLMDNARIHSDSHLVTYLRSLGIIVWFLPAYAPFFNPIEFVFGLLKRKLRKLNKNDDRKSTYVRVSEALAYFEDRDCTKLFEKCGYQTNGIFDPAKNFKNDSYESVTCN